MGKSDNPKGKRLNTARPSSKAIKKSSPGRTSTIQRTEASVTSVKIKREKIEQVKVKKVVSPEPKQTKLNSHYAKVPTIMNVEYAEEKETDPVHGKDVSMQDIQDEKSNLHIDNITTFIKDTPIEKLQAMQRRELLQVIIEWKKYKKESTSGLKTRHMDVLRLDIEDIKEIVRSENRQQELEKQIKETYDRNKEQVNKMDIDQSTTINDLNQYSHEDLCLFLYYKSGLMDKSVKLSDLKSKHEDEILAQTIHYIQMLKIPKQPEEKMITKLEYTMTEKDIDNMPLATLKKVYHQYTIDSGVTIPFSTIDIWTEQVIKDILKAKLQVLHSKTKTSSLKAKATPASTLKKTTKYGKKLVQTSLHPKQKTLKTCRYSVAFTIPDKYKGTEGLRKYLADILNEMVNYGDESFCILPWDTDEITNKIQDTDDLPTKITELKKYFNGARSPESSSFIYTKIRLGFSIGFDKVNFDADVQGYCKNKSIRFYECSVQHPNVRSCGWLAYVPRTLNQEKWCQAITQLYNTVHKGTQQQQFQIGLTWRVLNGQSQVDKKNKLRAMHVDAPVEIATKVKRFLRALSSKKRWILGVKFRMMDEFHQYMRPDMKHKYRYMVSKHRAMMQQIGICDCTQIINLDSKIGSSNSTVRDVVVNLRDNTDQFRIFATIDEKWNSDTIFSAVYRPDKASKAYDFMRSLATYVTYLYPQASLKRIFTPDAIEKAKSEKYDPETQTFTTQDDVDLYNEIQADLDDDSLEFLKIDDLEHPFEFDETINLVGGKSVWDFTGDNESVSTGAGTRITFDKANMRYYDTKSCASSIASSIASVESSHNKKKAGVPNPIQEEIEKLDIAATSKPSESAESVADPA